MYDALWVPLLVYTLRIQLSFYDIVLYCCDMKFSEAKQGRVFVMRLEDGDVLHEKIEAFAAEQEIYAASLIVLGGVDDGSKLIVGPEEDRADTITPIETTLQHMHEVAGVGTLFPGPDGRPSLHMHIACGREQQTLTGDIRAGVHTWHVIEVILTELLDCKAQRVVEPDTGFALLQP
jgi:predicted DNA-binding protein with PD1-like motif